MSAIRQFLNRVRVQGVRRPVTVTVQFMGRNRVFEAFDVGSDTFIFEKGVAAHLGERPSVLVAEKSVLRRKTAGRVMTLSTGNHAVAALPLLDGRFWMLSNLPASRRSATLAQSILCANVVKDTLEISQREVPTAVLVASDGWLRETVGFSMGDVVMGERNDATLEHFRQLGQEWRVKPLAWTESEMRAALAASRKRIATRLTYYHSAKGVHFLTYPEFRRFVGLAETDGCAFVKGLKELVGVYEGNGSSFMRMAKHRGHHEIELFGLNLGLGLERIVPELEKLTEAIVLGRIGRLGVIQKSQEIAALYRSLLSNRSFADENSRTFVEALYMHITGEVYAVAGEGNSPVFDDRRTALPGATFVGGRPILHPGADERTEVLLANLRGMMSKEELIEYANVYELRTTEGAAALGKGATREIVYKTNRRPLENSLVEKRLSRKTDGYASYVLARIGALRAIGISLSEFYIMLKRRPGAGKGACGHYIRRRCEGEPMEAIPASYFRSATDSAVEDREVVLALAALMGDAAAQNMAMKKYDPETQSPLYGVGKEIYAFEYDIVRRRQLPKSVSVCSIRGSFGWPELDCTVANFDALADFYFGHFARAVESFQRKHPSVTRSEVAERFMRGFEHRTHALAWRLSVMRDRFEAFRPDVLPRHRFDCKWHFVLWAIDQQERNLLSLRARFLKRIGK